MPTLPVNYAVRTSTGVQFRKGPLHSDNKEALVAAKTDTLETKTHEDFDFTWSKDGKRAAVVRGDCVQVLDVEVLYAQEVQDFEAATLYMLPQAKVHIVKFSPLGTYLMTYTRQTEESDIRDDKNRNLFMYHIDEKKQVLAIKQPEVPRKFMWPTFQFSFDEVIFGLTTANGSVRFYDTANATVDVQDLGFLLQVPRLQSFKFAPCLVKDKYRLVCYAASKKSEPATAGIFDIDLVNKPSGNIAQSGKVMLKRFFQSDNCVMKWNKSGDYVLVHVSTDSSKDMYYGESSLFLLGADKREGMTVSFEGNQGPVVHAEFSPTGKDFIVIQGNQPAKVKAYMCQDCKVVRNYGQCSRNRVSFSPHGRFLCIYGIGNLAGEFDFWDKNKFIKIGYAQVHGATSYNWSPDSRSYIVAVTRPRRRVDNSFSIFTYAGELIYKEKQERLYQVIPQPALRGTYPDRPMSARLKGRAKQMIEAAKPKRYIPPSLRAKGGSSIMNRTMEKATKVYKPLAQRKQTTGPLGYNPAAKANNNNSSSQAANKNAKRRANKKKRQAEQAAAAANPQTAAAVPVAEAKQMDPKEALEKKVRKISKVLKAIDLLKQKQSLGASLNAAQLTKLKKETGFRADLATATADLAAL